jgi:hypothetical protein
MQLKVNKYTLFYTLYVYFLVIFILLPTKYNGIPFGAHPIIALSIYTLLVLLPLMLIIIIVLDVINKRFKIAIKNILIVITLFFLTWGLKKYILDTYVYIKPDTLGQIEASPPMKTPDEK